MTTTDDQPRHRNGRWRARWRHEWLPLNWPAALLKAHGSRSYARRLLEGVRGRGAEHPYEPPPFLPFGARPQSHPPRNVSRETSAPAATSTPDVSRETSTPPAPLEKASDAELSERLGAADEAGAAAILAELDRRDRAAANVARRQAKAAAREAAKDAEYERLCDGGADPEQAYADVYGVTAQRQRRTAAAAAMRAQGYKGRGLYELCRAAHAEHAEREYYAAEQATRGHMLNKQGQARKVNPRSLFTGPESRARRYASEDLLEYWNRHGRYSVHDFMASAIGGRGHIREQAYFR